MQEVLMALVKSLTRLRGEASVTTWAYQVARNACSRQRRRRAAEPESFLSLETAGGGAGEGALDIPDRSGDPERELERRELGVALERAIAALPPSQRDVLVLRDVEGLKASEVGKVLGLGERAVKSRLHRARASLREALAPFATGGRTARKKKSCPNTIRLLSRYLEDDLDPTVCENLEAHIQRCRGCGEECDGLRQALISCRSWRQEKLPPGVQRAVRSAIQKVVETSNRKPARG
jgi:RNA polymerase sigma-70 factor (ECF subfamily)